MSVLYIALVSLFAQAPELEDLEPLEPAFEQPAQAVQETRPATSAPPARQTNPVSAYPHRPGTTLYVDATSLALRSGPKVNAALIHYMPTNASVTVLDDVIPPTPDTIGSRKGHWVHVQHDGHSGYAFDAYLVAAPPDLEETIDWTCVPGKRVGPITAETGYQDLVSHFGEANVGPANIPVGGGKYEEGAVVFADDPEKRLFIQWAVPREKPHSVIVEGTRWKTNKGIGVGTRLSQIVEANGAPISFAGFGWEYAGYVMSWRGGALETDHVLGEDVSLFVAAREPYLPDDYKALEGDREFSSDQPEAGRVNLHVKAMTIHLHE